MPKNLTGTKFSKVSLLLNLLPHVTAEMTYEKLSNWLSLRCSMLTGQNSRKTFFREFLRKFSKECWRILPKFLEWILSSILSRILENSRKNSRENSRENFQKSAEWFDAVSWAGELTFQIFLEMSQNSQRNSPQSVLELLDAVNSIDAVNWEASWRDE